MTRKRPTRPAELAPGLRDALALLLAEVDSGRLESTGDTTTALVTASEVRCGTNAA